MIEFRGACRWLVKGLFEFCSHFTQLAESSIEFLLALDAAWPPVLTTEVVA